VASDDGLRELYTAAHGRLVLQVTALTGDLAEAEDVVQEAFVRAMGRWSRIRGYDNPEAWVYSVACNLARSRWRRTQRALHLVPSPSIAAELSPDRVALLEALRALPADQREAVVLHHLVDLPIEEVATRQGVPVGTVKARLHRGRKALAAGAGLRDEEVALDG
jgi:RNA polymerase sigma-70 factor (ECF subfamily)